METLKLYVTATPGCSNPSYFGVGGFRAIKGGRELHRALFTFKGSKVTDFSVIAGTVARALEWCSEQREREVEIYLPWAKALNLLSGRWIPKRSEALLVEVKLRERWFDKVSYLLGRDAPLERELRIFLERRRRKERGRAQIAFASARGKEDKLFAFTKFLVGLGMSPDLSEEEFYLCCKTITEMFEHSMHFVLAPGTTEEIRKLARKLFKSLSTPEQSCCCPPPQTANGSDEKETFYIC